MSEKKNSRGPRKRPQRRGKRTGSNSNSKSNSKSSSSRSRRSSSSRGKSSSQNRNSQRGGHSSRGRKSSRSGNSSRSSFKGRSRPHRQRRRSSVSRTPEKKPSIWQRLTGNFKKPTPQIYEMAMVPSYDDGGLEHIPALFSKFPELVNRVPWIGLRSGVKASAPRCLMSSQHLFGENRIVMKNEVLDADLLSENNARKMEFVLAPILKRAPKRIVSFDRLGSSNALALAFAASYLQIPIELHLLRERCSLQAIQDLIEMKRYNAKVELYSSERSFELQFRWAKIFSGLRGSVIMPRGGYSIESVLGYISAPLELKAQIQTGECAEPDLFVMPISRGISLVGLEIGRRIAGLDKMRLMAIPSLGHSKLSGIELAELATQTLKELNEYLDKPLEMEFHESDFNIIGLTSDDFRKQRMERFMQRVMELESVEADLDYSGNALFALHEMIESQNIKGQSILFWNSFPGYRTRPMPEAEDLADMPSWLRAEYRSMLPAALLQKTRKKNRKRA